MPEPELHDLLDRWAARTRAGALDLILADHRPDARIFDVLPPLCHETPAAYRASFGDWQPQVAGEMVFQLEDLRIEARGDMAFAHGFLRCGGVTEAGKAFADLVRATFCFTRDAGGWRIAHQHVSAPR